MAEPENRYYVLPADDENITCVGKPELAVRFAAEFGDGTHIVDTLGSPYYPMVQRIEDGEAVFLEYGGWDTRTDPGGNLIEAVRKGYAPIVRAFLAKGLDVNAADRNGGTALIWSVAGGNADIAAMLIAAGADPDAADQGGMTAIELAKKRDRAEIAELLRAAGAIESA